MGKRPAQRHSPTLASTCEHARREALPGGDFGTVPPPTTAQSTRHERDAGTRPATAPPGRCGTRASALKATCHCCVTGAARREAQRRDDAARAQERDGCTGTPRREVLRGHPSRLRGRPPSARATHALRVSLGRFAHPKARPWGRAAARVGARERLARIRDVARADAKHRAEARPTRRAARLTPRSAPTSHLEANFACGEAPQRRSGRLERGAHATLARHASARHGGRAAGAPPPPLPLAVLASRDPLPPSLAASPAPDAATHRVARWLALTEGCAACLILPITSTEC